MSFDDHLDKLWKAGFDAGYQRAKDEMTPLMEKLDEILQKVENYKEEPK